jgi:hypothetical protein
VSVNNDIHYSTKINEKLRITGFMYFVQRPEFYISIKHNVSGNGSNSVFRGVERDTNSVGSLKYDLTSQVYVSRCMS